MDVELACSNPSGRGSGKVGHTSTNLGSVTTDHFFYLSKWYLDCVDEAGTVFIGYAARLRCGPLPLSYTASLIDSGGRIIEDRSYRRTQDPSIDSQHNVLWQPGRLGVRGSWATSSEPVERVLFRGEEGTVLWRCHAPRARAVVTTDLGGTIEGLGYVEQLVLTVPPWKLPIEAIHWGRFLSPTHELIWVVWEGGHPLCVLLHDQRIIDDVTLRDTGVDIPGLGQLNWHQTRAIVRRPVLGASWPLQIMARVVGAGRRFDMYEERWLSKGTVTGRGIATESGWVLHEKVTWR